MNVQVSVVPSLGWASIRAGSNGWPLMVQMPLILVRPNTNVRDAADVASRTGSARSFDGIGHAVLGDLVADAAGRVELIGEVVRRGERAVGDHQRDVEATLWQGLRVGRVVDDVHPRQAHPDVPPGHVHAVVVVPLEGAALV